MLFYKNYENKPPQIAFAGPHLYAVERGIQGVRFAFSLLIYREIHTQSGDEYEIF